MRPFLRAARRPGARALVAAAAAATLVAVVGGASGAVPANFQETVALSGLSNPTAVRFSADGRVFVAEKNGRVKVFSDLSDPTPTIFADLNAQVHNFWDRGLLGLALHPDFPDTPYVYVLYAFDGTIGGSYPRWGTPGVLSDPCPTPPGPTADGCLVGGRLSRLTASGDTWTGVETVLIEDFCQQYPSHSVGDIVFGADGALYVSAGDGASFNFVDYGQDGSPVNPCGDSPGGVGGSMTPPTAEGGALRSQDVRSTGDPTSLSGSLLRVDPITGAAMPDNPNALSSDPNTRRIVAHGFRNPFKIGIRPNTSEVWLGDVGWNDWEELNRVADPLGTVENFGWPCYEGVDEQPGYAGANLDLCESLYPTKPVVDPYLAYDHSDKVVAGEICPSGSSSVVGPAFYDGGNYPASYFGAAFFADYSRDCIWAMRTGANGLPDPNDVITFVSAAANPVDVEIGPGGDLFYADFDGGTIRRIRYLGANQAPVAVAAATPSSGTAPLTVAFSSTGSNDPDGGALAYAWDLDADGFFDDSTAAAPSFTYTTGGTYNVRLRVTDSGGATDVADVPVSVSTGAAPVPTMDAPAAGATWAVGDTISFSGSATDAEDGVLPASALTWTLIMHHCPSNCHTHPIQEFVGTAAGSFVAPDHEYPSHLELRLTATDSAGQSVSTSRQLDPKTTTLTFATEPPGLRLTVGPANVTTPHSQEVIVGSSNSVSALSPQNLDGSSYVFSAWSDGGAQSHTVVAPALPTTYTATFADAGPPVAQGLVLGMSFDEGAGSTANDASGNGNIGTVAGPAWTTQGRNGGALEFDGAGTVSVEDSATLDLTAGMTLEAWVYPTALSGAWRTVIMKELPGDSAYALYANEGPNVPGAHINVGGRDRRARGSSTLPLNTWTHLAASYDGAVLRLYVDGVERATLGRAGTIATSALPLRIGGNSIWPEPFQGRIDDVRVYSRALSPAEIQADMNTPVAPPPPADSTPPSAPGTLSATGSLGQAQLSWGAASDDTGVVRYNLHRATTAGFLPSSGNRIAQPTGLSYTDSAPAGVYFYKLIAEDAAGNLGPASNEASATITADTTPPTVSLTSPADGATLTGTATLTATAADNVNVAGVTFKDGTTTIGAEDTSPPYSLDWNTLSTGNGPHTLTATARDAAGNTTTSTPINITIDNTSPPPPTGLVAAYSFDAANGTTLADHSGNGNNGAITGATWASPGRFGSALDFDGSNDIVTIPDAASLDLTTGMTLEAWVKPAALGTAWRTILFKDGTGDLVYGLYANRNTGVPNAQVYVGSARSVNGTSSLPLDQWSHVATTYDGASLRLYVDGVQVAAVAQTGAMATSAGALRIGGNGIWAEWFRGLIDEVRVYDRALTPAEIQADMSTSVGVPDTSPPSTPTNLAKTGSTPTSVSVSWTASTDDAGIASYNLFRGGAAAGTSSSTTATFTGLTCGTSHDLAVQAVDFAGNVSGLATLTASTSDCDTTPPTVALTSPPAGTVSGLVSLAATAADDDAVAGVQFRLDGVALGAEDTTAPYSLSWDSRAAVNGAHVLTAVARDPSGNTTASAPVNVTVDNTGTPPPAGLVAAFAFDEGSGSTVEDASGQNNDGTIANATWSALGKFGPALSFDGNGDVVTVADAPSLDATTGLTLEAWVKPSALNTNWRTVLFKEQSGNLVYALYANRNTSVPAFEIHTGGVRTLNGVNQIALGFWTHLAATYDGANQRLYVNGNLVATRAQTGNITTSTGALKIGGNGIFGEWFAGLIDEVRVYNRALTQPEIQGDMASRVVPDTFPPTVAATTPAAGATGVAPDATLTATFGEQMNGTTFTSSTFELRDASNTLVPAAVSYNGGTGAASLDPTGVLAWGATYTARIKGGASGVKDVAGNALASDHTWTFTVEPPPPPILVLGSTTNRFSTYVEEILKAEGLNAYDTLDVALASPWLLPAYEVVVLGDVALTPAQVTMLTDYVTAGGNLIALSPDKQLAGLLGLTDAGSTLANGYLAVNGSAAPGAGIATQTMQFHGTADLYTTSGATTVASLYTDRSTPSPSPAVTLRSVGASGGQAAAFTYDLARSIVLTRQGNPAWVGQNRDGIGPPRPNDLFYGAAAGDPQPDWLDTQRIGIPQADEQQRLLANLIVETSRDRMPLPRFWYLPRGEKAAVVMTGDDHAVGGTEGRFAQYVAASPAGCSVVLWECVRGTSYIYPNNAHLTSSEAEALESQGFELAVHVNTNCATWTPGDLDVKFTTQLTDFADNYPTLDAPRTNRTHCVVWSDWATQATVSLSHGVRLDTNYYHYPEGWIGGLPGYMTGSALPMRFADLDGTPIDVYQAHTHMNDEAAQAYPLHVDYLLDKALGPEGYYGVLTANMHTDEVDSAGSDAIVASALARGVPVITARQLLTWLDGRDGSSFGAFGWSGDVLSFSVSVGSGATGLQAMLPVAAAGKTLSALARGGSPVPYTVETVKGIQYAVFAAAAGSYAATYAP